MNEKIIRLEAKNISKSFLIDIPRNKTALEGVVKFFQKKTEKKKLEVIKNLSLTAYSNEILGIIGKNACGKSTLLRMLAEIYKPDSGFVKSYGRIVYLSGFGQGLNPRLTMKDNIYLMGSVLGLSQKDIKRKYNEIIDFSELSEFIETPVYKFSTGMVIRLGFSVMIHSLSDNYPEIMLLDEILEAGGDINFKKKAMDKMGELIKRGALVILVSHDIENIKKYCDRVIWIDNGGIAVEGNPAEVVEKYEKSS